MRTPLAAEHWMPVYATTIAPDTSVEVYMHMSRVPILPSEDAVDEAMRVCVNEQEQRIAMRLITAVRL